jgi:hypothetical protein
MATSNSYDFSMSRDEIISAAYRKIGVIDKTEDVPADEMRVGAEALNVRAKAWMGSGLQIWLKEEATLFLVAGRAKYYLGSASVDNVTGEIDTVRSTDGVTAMRLAGIATDTILEVDSTTGMTAGDYIGVVLDDQTLYWTTVSTVTDIDTVVVATGLPSAAAIASKIYHYTTKIQRPLRIDSMMRRSADGVDTPIGLISDAEYQFLSLKNSQGRTNQAYYDPRRDSQGELSVWVTSDNALDTVYFTYHRPVQDFDSAVDTPDFPIEWSLALIYALAYDLAPENGIPANERLLLKQDRDEAKNDAMADDIENTSLFLMPDRRGY